jgi:hypothetical protein
MKSTRFKIIGTALLMCSGAALTAGCSETSAAAGEPSGSETVLAAPIVGAAVADTSVVDGAGNLRVPKD